MVLFWHEKLLSQILHKINVVIHNYVFMILLWHFPENIIYFAYNDNVCFMKTHSFLSRQNKWVSKHNIFRYISKGRMQVDERTGCPDGCFYLQPWAVFCSLVVWRRPEPKPVTTTKTYWSLEHVFLSLPFLIHFWKSDFHAPPTPRSEIKFYSMHIYINFRRTSGLPV